MDASRPGLLKDDLMEYRVKIGSKIRIILYYKEQYGNHSEPRYPKLPLSEGKSGDCASTRLHDQGVGERDTLLNNMDLVSTIGQMNEQSGRGPSFLELQNISEHQQGYLNDVTTSLPTKEDPFIYEDMMAYPTVRIVLMTLTVILTLIAVGGNVLVVLLIYRKKSLRRNPAILFILNLAVCDLVVSLLLRPMVSLEVYLPFAGDEYANNSGRTICRIGAFFSALFSSVGFHTVAAISQERLLLICFPLRAKSICSCTRTKTVILLIWLVAVAVMIPVPLRFTHFLRLSLKGVHITYCTPYLLDYTPEGMTYYTFLFTFYFAIPSLLLTVNYGTIFHVLYKRARCLGENEDSVASRSMRTRRSLAKMMLMVAVIFALSWGPNLTLSLYLASGGSFEKNGLFWVHLTDCLSTVSQALNPFIYTLNSRTFRRGFADVFYWRRKSREEFRRSMTSRIDSFFMSYNPALSTGPLTVRTLDAEDTKKEDVSL